MRACVVFNPSARGARARRFFSALQRLAPACRLCPTHHPGHAIELAARAAGEGVDTLVAAGGDGTLSEVVTGLARVPGALEAVRLGVIPLGTSNVFARELGLPRRPEAAWQVIQAGVERRVDLPGLEWGPPGQRQTRRFVQLAGAGLDSQAIARVHWGVKQRVGPLAYGLAGLQALLGPQPPVTLSAGGARLTGKLVLLGNGRYYGGPVPVFPAARNDDGLLDALVFPRVTWLTLARFALAWLTGRPLRVPGTQTLQAERLEVTCPEPLPVEVDGDNVGVTPGLFTVRPRALRVLAPAPGPGGRVA